MSQEAIAAMNETSRVLRRSFEETQLAKRVRELEKRVQAIEQSTKSTSKSKNSKED